MPRCFTSPLPPPALNWSPGLWHSLRIFFVPMRWLFSTLGTIDYASLEDAYSDWQLTPNFELWPTIFCVSTYFSVTIMKLCLSICLYPDKRNHLSFVNISPKLVIDASVERSSRVLHHENPIFFFKFEIEFWLVLMSWNHLSFGIISPTLIVDTSMESVSAVMFCKQFLAYAVHIDWCYHSIHKHSSGSRHAPKWWHRGSIVVPSRVDI